MKKTLLRLVDAVFITRPILLIPVWGFFILGYYRASLSHGNGTLFPFTLFGLDFPVLTGLGGPGVYLALFMCSLSVAGTYVLNQLTDIEADTNNAGLPLIAKAGFPVRLAVVENVLLCASPLVYAFFQAKAVFWLFIAAFALTVFYNVRPFRFTGRPFLDFLSNATAYGILCFGLGWLMATGGEFKDARAFLLQAAPYFFYMAAGSINSTIPDMAGDSRAGKTTTAVLLGARRAHFISTAAVFIALAFSLLNRDIIASITGLVCVPVFIKYIKTRDLRDGLRTFQFCGGLLMVLAAALFPWCLIWGVSVYIVTRLYFRLRHGVDYPRAGTVK